MLSLSLSATVHLWVLKIVIVHGMLTVDLSHITVDVSPIAAGPSSVWLYRTPNSLHVSAMMGRILG